MTKTLERPSNTIRWGATPERVTSSSQTFWKVTGWAVAAVSFITIIPRMIPIFGVAIQTPLLAASHFVDRFKNGADASSELKFRAEYYSLQIFKTLGLRASENRKATVAEFKAAANINPELAKLYNAPIKKKNKENASSAAMNGGVWAAGFLLPVVGEGVKVAVEGG